jgi:hypothetical protein
MGTGCAILGAPDACCERVGSHMEVAFSTRKQLNVATLMDDVLLQEAKVLGLGAPRDDAICREVASAFVFLGKKSHVTHKVKRRRLATGSQLAPSLALRRARHSASVAEAGRQQEVAGPLEILARSQVPRQLRVARKQMREQAMPNMKVSAHVHDEMTKGVGQKRIRALPLHMQREGAADRQAGSVQRHKLA